MSLVRIPLTFSISDSNLGSCWYNLTRWDGVLWIGYRGNTLINNCSLTSFDVADDYTYMFFLTANDSAGNTNYSNSSFSVSTSGSSSSSSSSSSSGGGGGGSGGIGSAITTFNTIFPFYTRSRNRFKVKAGLLR